MPMKTLLLLLSLYFSSGSVFGRLMETREACLVRYGEPQEASAAPLVWVKSGMRISAWFTRDGQCEKITYQKVEGLKLLTSTEIKVLLEANRNNRTWKEGVYSWETTEGWFCGNYDGQTLTFMTAYRRDQERKEAAQEAQKKAEEAKRKLEGL